jgi:plastocyanin domain-containing protein
MMVTEGEGGACGREPIIMLSGGGAVAVLVVTTLAMIIGVLLALHVSRSTESPQIVRLSLGAGGFLPEAVNVELGRQVEVRIFRREAVPCTDSVVLEDPRISRALTPRKAAVVVFTPMRRGDYTLRCGMGCWRATLKAGEKNAAPLLGLSD